MRMLLLLMLVLLLLLEGLLLESLVEVRVEVRLWLLQRVRRREMRSRRVDVCRGGEGVEARLDAHDGLDTGDALVERGDVVVDRRQPLVDRRQAVEDGVEPARR